MVNVLSSGKWLFCNQNIIVKTKIDCHKNNMIIGWTWSVYDMIMGMEYNPCTSLLSTSNLTRILECVLTDAGLTILGRLYCTSCAFSSASTNAQHLPSTRMHTRILTNIPRNTNARCDLRGCDWPSEIGKNRWQSRFFHRTYIFYY